MDSIAQMKAAAREGWATFAPFEMITATAAPWLVKFAGVSDGVRVLDVACGTGVAGLCAARSGARVTGADLAPALLVRARENATLAGLDVDFHEADVEALPFDDGEFDIVLSQFGHMFGPRPQVTLQEMLRVLKPGGTIAFSTWPPELFTGQLFALVGRYAPPPPADVPPPTAWGDPGVVRERVKPFVTALQFDQACMRFPTISPAHMRHFLECNAAPVAAVVAALAAETDRLAVFRAEIDALVARFYSDNTVRQDFLMTRATKT